MSEPSAPSPSPPVAALHDEAAASARRARILDAAERCFVRAGFHRTTMQDVASEAAMSPGNLYRYFASKDALVAGLSGRDRAECAEGFAALADADDLGAAFAALAHHHFGPGAREKAVLCLEIWAESTRSPAIAALMDEFECEVQACLTEVFRQGKARGTVAPGVDPAALVALVSATANGLLVRRAILPRYDAEHEIAQFVAIIEAGAAGRVALTPVPAASSDAPAPLSAEGAR